MKRRSVKTKKRSPKLTDRQRLARAKKSLEVAYESLEKLQAKYEAVQRDRGKMEAKMSELHRRLHAAEAKLERIRGFFVPGAGGYPAWSKPQWSEKGDPIVIERSEP